MSWYTSVLFQLLDLRVDDPTNPSGNCWSSLYVYDSQTSTYKQWCAVDWWTSSTSHDQLTVGYGNGGSAVRTIDVVFSTTGSSTNAAAWLSVQGRCTYNCFFS